ncbi:hypothetical protein PR048_016314 [Dryococelus australis]|uniref:Uncharacterized protein n=1 Tax=Dryococelus australis TaxID=614101 RepID=A0ABQ9HJD6_9NEOP|nr:hypothetical protein PR048_016314 [Dryococelus australis]
MHFVSAKCSKDIVPEFDAFRDLPCLWKVNEKKLILIQLGTLCWGDKKKHNLRSSFREELKKVQQCKKSEMSTQDAYLPKLWFYQNLLLLVD